MTKAWNNSYPGGVVEQGSNANGEFIKYVDGSMVCWRNGLSGETTWTFPKAFISAPEFAIWINQGVAPVAASADSVTATSCYFQTEGDVGYAGMALARGYWK